jgi:hypothetical protein
MKTVDAPINAREVLGALHRTAARVEELLTSGIDPTAPALGVWNVAELAMHLSQAWMILPGLVKQDLSESRSLLPELPAHGSPLQDLWDSEAMMMRGVRADQERDLAEIAGRIAHRAEAFVDEAPRLLQRTHGEIPWVVEGVTVSPVTLLCHLLSETLVHGFDIAKATGRKWSISGPDARLVFEGQIVPVMRRLPSHAAVNQEAAQGVVATYELSVRGGGRYLLHIDQGTLSVVPATRRSAADCHISCNPTALLLTLWGRESQYRFLAQGKLLAWGRKPWLALKMKTLLRNP